MPAHWWGPFAVWDGGLGIWGGIAAGAWPGSGACAAPASRPAPSWTRLRPRCWSRQAIGRIGNYFNQELFGGPTSLPWGLQISPAHRPAGYASIRHLPADLPLRADLEPRPGRVPRLARAPPPDRPPGLFALYVTGYSAFRIFEESLRVDPAHHILGLRLNFYVACLLTIAGAAWFVASQRRP